MQLFVFVGNLVQYFKYILYIVRFIALFTTHKALLYTTNLYYRIFLIFNLKSYDKEKEEKKNSTVERERKKTNCKID